MEISIYVSILTAILSGIGTAILSVFASRREHKNHLIDKMPSDDDLKMIFSNGDDYVFALAEKRKSGIFSRYFDFYPSSLQMSIARSFYEANSNSFGLTEILHRIREIGSLEKWRKNTALSAIRYIFKYGLLAGVIALLGATALCAYLIWATANQKGVPPSQILLQELLWLVFGAIGLLEAAYLGSEIRKVNIAIALFDHINRGNGEITQVISANNKDKSIEAKEPQILDPR